MDIFGRIKEALGFSQPAPAPEPEPAAGGVFGSHRITEDGYLVRNEFNFNNYMNFKAMEDDLPHLRCNYDTTVDVDKVEGLNQLARTDPFTGQKEYISEDRFWQQHGYDKDSYLKIASHVPEINEKLDGLSGEEAGRVIAGLKNSEDENVRLCADMYFNPNYKQRIHAVKFGDQYEIDNGRHRVEALAEVKERDRMKAIQNGQDFDESRYNLPVTVTGYYQMPGYSMGADPGYKIQMPSMFASQTEGQGSEQPGNAYAPVPAGQMNAGTGSAPVRPEPVAAQNTGYDQDVIRRPETPEQKEARLASEQENVQNQPNVATPMESFRQNQPVQNSAPVTHVPQRMDGLPYEPLRSQAPQQNAPTYQPQQNTQAYQPQQMTSPEASMNARPNQVASMAPRSEQGRDNMQGREPAPYQGLDLTPGSEQSRDNMQGRESAPYQGPDLTPRSGQGQNPMQGRESAPYQGPDLTPRSGQGRGSEPSRNAMPEKNNSPSQEASRGTGPSSDSGAGMDRPRSQGISW